MKILALGVALLGITSTGCSQDVSASKVPSVVSNTLQAAYPGVTTVDWDKKKNFYEAEFKQNNREVTAEIDANGKLIRQKEDITQQDLPSALQQAIPASEGYVVDDIDKVTLNGTTFYQVELDGKGKNKDKKLVFEANGQASSSTYWD